MENSKLNNELFNAIIEDEKEYCFDKSYCDDETWKETFGDETREKAFNEIIEYWSILDVEKVRKHFGDKYDYIIEKY